MTTQNWIKLIKVSGIPPGRQHNWEDTCRPHLFANPFQTLSNWGVENITTYFALSHAKHGIICQKSIGNISLTFNFSW